MNADDQLNQLKKIRQVDAPPFLYTRIRSRIEALSEAQAPVQWVWEFSIAGMLVLALNIGALIITTRTKSESSVFDVVSALQLSDKNDLYYE